MGSNPRSAARETSALPIRPPRPVTDNEPHRQEGVDMMVLSCSIGAVMVSTLAQNGRDVGSIPTLDPICHILVTHHDSIVWTIAWDPNKPIDIELWSMCRGGRIERFYSSLLHASG